MRRRGFHVAAASESFYVTGTAGPLVEGESQRACDGARLSVKAGQELALMAANLSKRTEDDGSKTFIPSGLARRMCHIVAVGRM